jgi:hypothetical protein
MGHLEKKQCPAGLQSLNVGLNGGGDRGRTGDPQLAKLVLSQLSYAPTLGIRSGI